MIKLKTIINESGISISSNDLEPLKIHINRFIISYGSSKIVKDITKNNKCWFDFKNQIAHIWKDIEFDSQYLESLYEIAHLVQKHKFPNSTEEQRQIHNQAVKFVKKNSIIKIPNYILKLWKI